MSSALSLGRDKIIRLRNEIKLLFSSKTKHFTYDVWRFSYVIIPSDDKQKWRCLFLAPKKRFRKAVERNKVKRKMREFIRLNQNSIKVKNGVLLFSLTYIGRLKNIKTISNKTLIKGINALSKNIS